MVPEPLRGPPAAWIGLQPAGGGGCLIQKPRSASPNHQIPCSARYWRGCRLGGPICPSERRSGRAGVPASGLNRRYGLSSTGSPVTAGLPQMEEQAGADHTPADARTSSGAIVSFAPTGLLLCLEGALEWSSATGACRSAATVACTTAWSSLTVGLLRCRRATAAVEEPALGVPWPPGGSPGAVGTIPYGVGRPGRRCCAHERDPHIPSHSAAGGSTSGAFRWRDSRPADHPQGGPVPRADRGDRRRAPRCHARGGDRATR